MKVDAQVWSSVVSLRYRSAGVTEPPVVDHHPGIFAPPRKPASCGPPSPRDRLTAERSDQGSSTVRIPRRPGRLPRRLLSASTLRSERTPRIKGLLVRVNRPTTPSPPTRRPSTCIGGLAAREPDHRTPNVAQSPTNNAAALLDLGPRDDALALRGEAIALWAQLAHRHADNFDEGYQCDRAALARFCTEHNYAPGAATQAETTPPTSSATPPGEDVANAHNRAEVVPDDDKAQGERRTTGALR